ncbi:MAG: hypothetical protein AMS21_04440 [Gemmatimonas sp. SG8_38_2]|jgi:hypothetical protein|nr:MAG: hypothetical protein AMS21_04440 [Gemmatimonas sp. SG8_38_2]
MSTTEKPFRSVVLEVAAIVLSILLAFTIDASWQQRGQSREARELLTGLQSEFEFQRSELVRFRDRWRDVRVGTERLLEFTGSGLAPEPAVMDSLILDLLNPATFDPRTGTLEAAKGSGQLGLIGSRELRDRLAAWEGVVDEVRDNEVAMRAFILSTIVPYLAERGVPVPRAWSLLPNMGLLGEQGSARRWPGGLTSDAEAAEAYASLVSDPEFQVLVSARYTWINVEEYNDAITFVDELLRLIAQDLAR